MNHLSKDQSARNNLKDLATDPNLQKVGREGQDAALKNLADSPQSSGNLNNVKQNLKERADLENNTEL